jgi:SAM-dependent methyltransferase
MSNWSSGYVADIGYTYGYYPELNPLKIRLAFLNAGLVCPTVGSACELGFGQGVSANLHAAASLTSWHGTDFNPSQASFAQELADTAESGAKLYDESFSEFAGRSDLPDFDYIGLHGIWSWISDDNRKVIVDFIRRKLKVGGVLYISYNTMPGWAAFAPMRHLMTEHAEVIGSEGRGIVSRIDDAIEFANKLLETNPLFARANPLISDRISKLKNQNRHYLAHEYFNRDWHPMHFSTMAEWLEPAKLNYACSANYVEHIDAVNLTADQQAFLKEIPDPMFKESVRDFMVNQQFRRDYWVKGLRKLTVPQQAESLRAEKVVLMTPHSEVKLKVKGALGEADLNDSVLTPILEYLSDHKARTLYQIEKAVAGKDINLGRIMYAVMVLSSAGYLGSAQEEAVITKCRKRTDKLNSWLLQRAKSSGEINFLACPVTGGGYPIGRFQQLFLLAMAEGKKQPVEWAQSVWQIVHEQGHKLLKDGKAIETEAENIAELTEQARVFAEKNLPIVKALQIV